MQVNFDHPGKLLLIAISGRLDTNTAPEFDAQVTPLLAQPNPNIVVDLSGVTYISSAGLRSILQLVKHTAAHGGRVGLFGAPSHILEVIEISGFPALLDLYPNRESAIAQHPA
jgi:anti-sigma B factor antagonist